MINWITDYSNHVRCNPTLFNRNIKSLIELVNKLLKRKNIEYKPTDVEAFVEYCKLLKHKEGSWAGMPFILNKEELFIAACVLGIKQYDSKKKRWLRYFRELNLFVARKFGKTLFVSALAGWLLGFDKEGGPFGEILAENEIQAKKLYSQVCSNLTQKEFRGVFKENKTDKELKCLFNDGTLVYLSGREKGKQGSNPSFFINDEANEITKIGQYTNKKQGMGARDQPLAIVISSAGITPDSLYEVLYNRNIIILSRKVFSDKDRIFPIMYGIDPEDKVSDVKCWIKANPCMYEDRPSLNYLEQIYETAKTDEILMNKFIAFNLNRQVSAGVNYFNLALLKKSLSTLTTQDIYDTYAVGGVDLAETTDLCNATALILRTDNKFAIIQAYFIAEECIARNSAKDKIEYSMYENCPSDDPVIKKLLIVTPGSYVEHSYVTEWFVYLRDTYKINFLKIGYDRWMSKQWLSSMAENGFIKEKVSIDANTGVETRDFGIMTAVAQGGYTLSGAIKIIKNLYTDNKIIQDKTNKLLPYCFYNLRIKIDSNNNMTPHKSKSTGHIDGAIGVFNAFVAYDRSKPLYENELADYFKI